MLTSRGPVSSTHLLRSSKAGNRDATRTRKMMAPIKMAGSDLPRLTARSFRPTRIDEAISWRNWINSSSPSSILLKGGICPKNSSTAVSRSDNETSASVVDRYSKRLDTSPIIRLLIRRRGP